MKLSTVFGSALGVLLVFSVFSYAQTYVRTQEPKPAVEQQPVLDVAGQIPESTDRAAAVEALAPANKAAEVIEPVVAAQNYEATAYSLRGRMASGRQVSRGLIAADPRVLPLGTRVRVDAGNWTGEYLVADTGGAVRGRRIDIWTPTSREAMQFGRRTVKLTVLSFPNRQTAATRPRLVKPATAANQATAEQTNKQEK